ncbi:hypothetical protein [Stappia albiluteola]|uniref:hypothetical protein n=1 Tax=Stappia albiluteola TaxID=2758565 RepID=UPI001AD8D25E|nr:hypothetical protein [Stappia albiluteola]
MPCSFPGKGGAGFSFDRKTGRREFAPVRIVGKPAEGRLVVEQLGNGSSGTLYPLCRADGLLVIPEAMGDVKAGHALDFLPMPHARC